MTEKKPIEMIAKVFDDISDAETLLPNIERIADALEDIAALLTEASYTWEGTGGRTLRSFRVNTE